jgi:hypothetical protein
MNKGIRIRVALAVLTSLNTSLLATDITGFANPTVDFVYKIVSIIVNFIVVALTTYYNNDFTQEACLGTAMTRQLKAEQKEDYIGDYFYTEVAEGGDVNESDNL